MMRSFGYAFLCGLIALSGCKKSTSPEDETPVNERLVNRITQKELGATPSVPGKSEFIFLYDASSRLIKVTSNLIELPAGVVAQSNGQYDSYEYNGAGLLSKRNLYRFNLSTLVLELTQYVEYTYDTQGLLSKATSFTRRQGPPDGSLIFRPGAYDSFRYNEQKQLLEQQSFIVSGYDNLNKETYRIMNIYRFQYNAAGNIAKRSTYTEAGRAVEEIAYNQYDTRKNPFYNQFIAISGLLSFSTDKNHPLNIGITTFTSDLGAPDLTSTRKFSITYANDDYPVAIKEENIYKSYVTAPGSNTPVVQTINKAYDWTFEYK
ncbi:MULTISPECIES: hypothetical protein [Pedobacter]|uniref:YD repeat-containing protein n=1 Tax=Pedobacter heparinus (strain ATCC 13125 / DSM 2366 / CIP 104194 / JCM 7457 / NBRC 12017 / NCIMB 9290 / NRRL B-14731 / HIM 762-3) TaxID=485917 RepID=C6Y3Z4_PEDHD|nr:MULTISPECIES: hypothetical protein [Pedobacter]ACU05437.1 hypothetical protein Phep_3242 [Pedobacter heparinus DSM 2366]MBB5439413.1 hypothetical protein [Pedobacter sp. AK017]